MIYLYMFYYLTVAHSGFMAYTFFKKVYSYYDWFFPKKEEIKDLNIIV